MDCTVSLIFYLNSKPIFYAFVCQVSGIIDASYSNQTTTNGVEYFNRVSNSKMQYKKYKNIKNKKKTLESFLTLGFLGKNTLTIYLLQLTFPKENKIYI